MSTDDFSQQQYVTLRAEISESKSRIFWLLIVGMLLVLASGYLAAEHPSGFTNAAIPFLLLALMLSFIAEESNVSRAGRYLREVIEPNIKDLTYWEHWLESQTRYREVDRAFVVGFSVIFLTFFVTSAGLTLQQLDISGRPQQLVWAAGIAYGLGALCIIYVLKRHWSSSTKPS
jgi:uncharacterized membrane protein (DUF485 family)